MTGLAQLSLTLVCGAGRLLRHRGSCKDVAVRVGKTHGSEDELSFPPTLFVLHVSVVNRTDSKLRYGRSSVYRERAWKEEGPGL